MKRLKKSDFNIGYIFYGILCLFLIRFIMIPIVLILIIVGILYLIYDKNQEKREQEFERIQKENIILNMTYTKDTRLLKIHERCKNALERLRKKEDIHKILGDKPEDKYRKVLNNIYIIYKDEKFKLMKDEIVELLEELEKYLNAEFLRYKELEQRDDKQAKEVYKNMIEEVIHELDNDIEYSEEFRKH